MPRLLILATVAALTMGCTHLQLERSTQKQLGTLTDLQYCQVLDNIAMFQRNPNSLPFFALTASGIAQITDTGSTSDTGIPNFLPGGIWSANLNLMASRAIQENWTVLPITDPDKLKNMRCAYQKLFGCTANDCDDCAKRLQNHFCAKQCEKKGDPSCDTCNNCAIPTGWFCAGGKKDVPHNACYVGHYGHQYVWVMPEGVDGLTRFTLAILDIATSTPDVAQVKRIYPDDRSTPERVEIIHSESWPVDRKDGQGQPAKLRAQPFLVPSLSPLPPPTR